MVLKGKVVEGGRIIVPAPFRETLGLSKGDTVFMDIVDGQLRVRPARSALRRIQAKLRGLVPESSSMPGEATSESKIEIEHG